MISEFILTELPSCRSMNMYSQGIAWRLYRCCRISSCVCSTQNLEAGIAVFFAHYQCLVMKHSINSAWQARSQHPGVLEAAGVIRTRWEAGGSSTGSPVPRYRLSGSRGRS